MGVAEWLVSIVISHEECGDSAHAAAEAVKSLEVDDSGLAQVRALD
jgi:hypothetical protein